MDSIKPTYELFSLTDRRQERIYRRLRLLGDGPAALYRDACRLMAMEPPLETTSHLVAHCLREIESALRSVLKPFKDEADEPTGRGRANDKNDNHERDVRAVLRGLAIPETDEVAQAWIRITTKEYGLAARAHRNALTTPRPLNQEFHEFWDGMQAVLDVVLGKFEARYLETYQLIRELLNVPTPSDDDIKKLRQEVPNNLVALGHFFENLAHPDWVQPLAKDGFFNTPPELQHDGERGTVRFPPWPASAYLARMAPHNPSLVLGIALQIPETANARIHQDLAEAALAMPGKLAARWASKETEWVRSQDFLDILLPDVLGRLVAHLAKENQSEHALALAQAVLQLSPGHETVLPEIEETRKLNVHRPAALCGIWDYGQLLHNYLPDLIRATPIKAFVILCDLLQDAIRFSSGTPTAEGEGKGKRPADYSFIWAPTLDSTNNDRSLRGLLVSGVHDAAQQIAKHMPSLLNELILILEKRLYPVFQRIALSVLQRFPNLAPELIGAWLTKRNLFEDSHFWQEYFALLHAQFGQLRKEEQAVILSWIEGGPTTERFADRDEPGASENTLSYTKNWKRDRLSVISKDLNEDWQKRYKWLVAETDPAETLRPFNQFAARQLPSIVPEAATQFRTMSVEEVVNYIESWQPSGAWDEPSDLSLTVIQEVAANPGRFALEAEHFQRLSPDFTFALLEGLRQGAEQQRQFQWEPVLAFCQWILKQSRGILGVEEQGTEDWGRLRTTLARLLAMGFRQDNAEIPTSLRTTVWSLLDPLTNDASPTPEEEERHSGAKIDLAIRTTRGEAINAVIDYAFWVRRNSPEVKEAGAGGGFEALPEVRQVLETHLDPLVDPSLAVRAVYGRRFPDLYLLDRNWASLNAAKIFAFEGADRAWGVVAWGTYIGSFHPCDNLLDLLDDQYSQAAKLSGAFEFERGFLGDPDERLAEHLMMFYASGRFDLQAEGDPLVHFFQNASDDLRHYALEYIGRYMVKSESVESNVLARLQRLWIWRVEQLNLGESPTTHHTELTAFGWWFASAKFDDEWSIDQLKIALGLAETLVPNHLVIQRLADIVEPLPLAAIECLSLVIEGIEEKSLFHLRNETVRTILTIALDSNNPEARQAAIILINRLGARGVLEFQDLLYLE